MACIARSLLIAAEDLDHAAIAVAATAAATAAIVAIMAIAAFAAIRVAVIDSTVAAAMASGIVSAGVLSSFASSGTRAATAVAGAYSVASAVAKAASSAGACAVVVAGTATAIRVTAVSSGASSPCSSPAASASASTSASPAAPASPASSRGARAGTSSCTSMLVVAVMWQSSIEESAYACTTIIVVIVFVLRVCIARHYSSVASDSDPCKPNCRLLHRCLGLRFRTPTRFSPALWLRLRTPSRRCKSAGSVSQQLLNQQNMASVSGLLQQVTRLRCSQVQRRSRREQAGTDSGSKPSKASQPPQAQLRVRPSQLCYQRASSDKAVGVACPERTRSGRTSSAQSVSMSAAKACQDSATGHMLAEQRMRCA